MIPVPQLFPDNARVRLRDGVNPNFYEGFGLPGNEGWVREHKAEKYGYQQVFIEWDKNHWAYNGAPDGWTWEGHFEQAEETMSENGKDDNLEQALGELTKAFAQGVAGLVKGTSDEPEDDKGTDDGPLSEVFDITSEADIAKDLSYNQTLEKAAISAEESESFVMVAVKEIEVAGVKTYTPVVYHAARDIKSSLLCNLQLSHIASNFAERLAMDAIYKESGDALEEDE